MCRNGTSLTDLLWQHNNSNNNSNTSSKASAPGLAYFAQHPSNGLAALAMAQPSQVPPPLSMAESLYDLQ